MAYSFQTFSVGQIFTAGQANQIEANTRDHVHGVAGVAGFTSAQLATALSDETGTGLAVFSISPVFTTQITTPQIVTASGNLTLTPAGTADIILTGSATGKVGIGTTVPVYKLGVEGNTTDWVARIYQANATGFGLLININNESAGGYAFGVYTNGIYRMVVKNDGYVGIGTTSPAALFSVGSTSQFAVGATGIMTAGTVPSGRLYNNAGTTALFNSSTVMTAGTVPSGRLYDNAGTTALFNSSTVMTAGTVPLARMMRTEVQGSASAKTVDLDLGTVVTGDRILLTGILSLVYTGATSHYPKWAETGAGTAVVDFAGASAMRFPDRSFSSDEETVSGVCRVTTGGTLVLRFEIVGETYASGTIYGHAIVLNNG